MLFVYAFVFMYVCIVTQVNDISLEYVTHDDAVAAIASVVEEFNEIVLRVAKATQFATETVDEETLK